MLANKRTLQDLQMMQALPLNIKVRMTEERIRSWVDEYGLDGVYVSFSGGKDSTVLLHIARKLYPNIRAMFVDVPTQYPELRDFVDTYSNVDIIRPKITFMEVCKKYGFPLISKEVSECVEGARKYLTKIKEEMTLKQGRPYAYKFRQLTGQGEYSKFSESLSNEEIITKAHMDSIRGGYEHYYQYETSRLLGTCRHFSKPTSIEGGYDNKYRKVRGIGEYSKSQNGQSAGWKQSEISNYVGNADKGQESSGSGEYP